jgi:hypothetical protein
MGGLWSSGTALELYLKEEGLKRFYFRELILIRYTICGSLFSRKL